MSEQAEQQRRSMVAQQLAARGIVDVRVLAAMAAVPRERFVPDAAIEAAYSDNALPIDCGQTISQPYMVALMTQALELTGQERVLEVGTGSGYQTAVLARLAGQVVSIERFAELAAHAGRVLAALGIENVELIVGDGSLGWPAGAPYDRILVTAAAEEAPPQLLDQLADTGILVIPVGPRDRQSLRAIRKEGSKFTATELTGCRFVPLIGAGGWPR
jgi:protein-L-isoaspartate(D-aspartate) O-methyltransferase